MNGLFVRRKHRTVFDDDHRDFTVITLDDYRCRCRKPESDFKYCRKSYQIG